MGASTSADGAAGDDAASVEDLAAVPPVTPLLVPRDGTPDPVIDPVALAGWAARFAAPGGPVALDAERASGFRYSGRAFLVQIRRADLGTVLLDPIALGDLAPLDGPLSGSEWVLHAASQDLACLAEVGIRPRTLFDTELAGRLAGLPRVGLGPLVERMLGLGLAKGHGAADWSTRPLPGPWLTYAALDVEVLLELRDAMEGLLRDTGKLEWARQEFAALVAAPPAAPRLEPWRRTSGIHRFHDPRTLAVIRELWQTRDQLAERRDLAPHRVLPDSAIVTAAVAMPASATALSELPVYTGRAQRRLATTWFDAIERARALPAQDQPRAHPPSEGPPPAARWAAKDPAAAARLTAARAGLAALSERVAVPVENLMLPDLVRRVLWDPPDPDELDHTLRTAGARPWQVELVAPVLRAALPGHDGAAGH